MTRHLNSSSVSSPVIPAEIVLGTHSTETRLAEPRYSANSPTRRSAENKFKPDFQLMKTSVTPLTSSLFAPAGSNVSNYQQILPINLKALATLKYFSLCLCFHTRPYLVSANT